MSKSPLAPDSNHLHQQLFYLINKKTKIKIIYSNLLTSNLINLYNLFIFFIAFNYIYSSQIQVLLILFNICVYTFAYFKLFVIRYKKI